MSKRGQEATSSEGSPMAKPKQMVPAKAMTRQLGGTQPVEREGKSSAGFESGECRWRGQGSQQSARRLVLTTQSPEIERSQVRRQENAQNSDSWKQGDQEESSNSTSTRRLCTGSDSKNRVSEHEDHKPWIHEKGFPILAKEVVNPQQVTQHLQRKHQRPMYWCGDCSCHRQWKQPLVLDRIIWRIWRSTRTRTSRQKLILEHSEEILNVHIIESASFMDEISIVSWSSDPVDKSKSTCSLRFRTVPGEDEWQQWCNYKMWRSNGRIQKCPLFTKNCWASMENLRNSQSGSSSCQCSMTSIGPAKDRWNLYFEFRKSRNTRKDSCRDTGCFSVLDTKRSGMELFLVHLKEKVTPQPFKWWNDSKIPVIQVLLSRGILKKEEEQTHFSLQCGRFKYRALVPNHSFCKSAQTLRSSYELVWTVRLDREEKEQEKQKEPVTEGALTSVKSQAGKLLVSSPRLVSGYSLRENIQDFEYLSETIRLTWVCELASFWHRVSAGMSYKTRPDEDDGFGQIIHYAENTRFSSKPTIQSFCSNLKEEQLLGQSLKFRSWKFLTNMDLKMQFHHSNDTQRTSYDMISRWKSRFVDEVRIPNAELRSRAEVLSELQKAGGG